MSALLNFAIFPTDKGDSVSTYVSKVIKMISESGYPYSLTSMSTIVETAEVSQALEIIQKAYDVLNEFSDRVYISANIDVRNNTEGRINSKIESVMKNINR